MVRCQHAIAVDQVNRAAETVRIRQLTRREDHRGEKEPAREGRPDPENRASLQGNRAAPYCTLTKAATDGTPLVSTMKSM